MGHASVVGENTLLCAQALGGSSKMGAKMILTGQVGVAGHPTIGDGVIATAQTGIPNDVAPDTLSPATPPSTTASG